MNVAHETWSAERSSLAADALRRGGRLRLRVRGESMLPSVWPGDLVEIESCALAEIRPGEIALAMREGRLFLHRFLAHHEDGFVLRGDSRNAPDPAFSSSAFQGRLVAIVRGKRTVSVSVPLARCARALGRLLCYCDTARRMALKFHSWRASRTHGEELGQAVALTSGATRDAAPLQECFAKEQRDSR